MNICRVQGDKFMLPYGTRETYLDRLLNRTPMGLLTEMMSPATMKPRFIYHHLVFTLNILCMQA